MSNVMGKPEDVEAITRIEYGMANAQTMDECLQWWHDDIVQIDIMPGALYGLEAARKNLAPQFAGVADIRCEINELHVVVDGDMGYAHSTMDFRARQRSHGPYGNAELFDDVEADPGEIHMSWRQTDIYRRTDKGWMVVHQHSSFPIDRDTGRAIMLPDRDAAYRS